jgi:hypothetical protein
VRQTTTRTYAVTLNFDGWKVDVDVTAEVRAERWTEPHGETLMEVESVTIDTRTRQILEDLMGAWGEDFPDTPCPITLEWVEDQRGIMEEQITDAFEWNF